MKTDEAGFRTTALMEGFHNGIAQVSPSPQQEAQENHQLPEAFETWLSSFDKKEHLFHFTAYIFKLTFQFKYSKNILVTFGTKNSVKIN